MSEDQREDLDSALAPEVGDVRDADGFRRDEFGNRVDEEGNRVDGDGRPVDVDGDPVDPYTDTSPLPGVAAGDLDDDGDNDVIVPPIPPHIHG